MKIMMLDITYRFSSKGTQSVLSIEFHYVEHCFFTSIACLEQWAKKDVVRRVRG